MSNVFIAVGHGIEVAGKDVAHVAVAVVDYLPRVSAVIASAIKDEPEVKTLVTQLITEATTVIAAGTTAVASDGTNLLSDAATLAAAEAFFAWFKSTFIVEVEAIYKDVAADVATA